MTIKNGLPPVHPGQFLKEILEECSVTQAEFARQVGISPMRVTHLIKGVRPISAELALLFGRAFGQSPEYWLNLQKTYDLKMAEKSIKKRLMSICPFKHSKV